MVMITTKERAWTREDGGLWTLEDLKWTHFPESVRPWRVRENSNSVEIVRLSGKCPLWSCGWNGHRLLCQALPEEREKGPLTGPTPVINICDVTGILICTICVFFLTINLPFSLQTNRYCSFVLCTCGFRFNNSPKNNGTTESFYTLLTINFFWN